MWRSRDGGRSWFDFSEYLGPGNLFHLFDFARNPYGIRVNDVATNPHGTRLFAATPWGVFARRP